MLTIVNSNIANQIHGFKIDYGKCILIIDIIQQNYKLTLHSGKREKEDEEERKNIAIIIILKKKIMIHVFTTQE